MPAGLASSSTSSSEPVNAPSTPTAHWPEKPPSRRQAWRIVAVALVLLGAWRGVLGVTRWRADFAETNYQQNLLRIESFHRRMTSEQPATTVLAGTSITGRLLPQFFDRTPLAGQTLVYTITLTAIQPKQ